MLCTLTNSSKGKKHDFHYRYSTEMREQAIFIKSKTGNFNFLNMVRFKTTANAKSIGKLLLGNHKTY